METTQEPLTDEQAGFFHELYLNYAPFMRAEAEKYVASAEVSEDIIHDVMLRLFRQYDKLAGFNTKMLAAYIARAVRNTALNHLRDSASEISSERVGLAETYAPSPEDTLLLLQQDEALASALLRLPADDRCMLLEYCALGIPPEDIAETYGYTLDNLRVKISRLRRRLMYELEKEGYDDEY